MATRKVEITTAAERAASKGEVTSKRVASSAGKAMRGPSKKDIENAWIAYGNDDLANDPIKFGMDWWHNKVKSAVASALTQVCKTRKDAYRMASQLQSLRGSKSVKK